ncbi:hypothetical protein SAMN02745221_00179 [Thermosyntropha lipolytica DSM 11003]|uniref:FG-GAP repeat-containing protein n=1 Tax=Thermosyntropha lipolytica DSM 11003 TaxID=1123382 RepID=A0A1M5JQQ8_9FIRM|nr:Cys-Cys-COOH (seleno)protein SaoC [Thermosyntropha lipolytica]SHG42620.1 hypothetical protein SAMN02745221_00179 [Thermosyntropha lipolytica DSM 11003]
MKGKNAIKVALFLIALILAGSLLSKYHASNEGRQVGDWPEALREWQEANPGKEVVVWAEGDLDGDGAEDLVIIYRQHKKCFTRVLIRKGNDYRLLRDMPAPVENQQIQFRDIDNKPPVELIISGTKGSEVGYAIYRIEEEGLIDLFAENMDNCC